MYTSQGGRCAITGNKITLSAAIDHAHNLRGRDSVRGLIEPRINAVLPNRDKDLIKFAGRLSKYASARLHLLLFRDHLKWLRRAARRRAA